MITLAVFFAGPIVQAMATFDTKTIELAGIKADTKKQWHPPFRKVVAISLRQAGIDDGREVTRVFN